MSVGGFSLANLNPFTAQTKKGGDAAKAYLAPPPPPMPDLPPPPPATPASNKPLEANAAAQAAARAKRGPFFGVNPTGAQGLQSPANTQRKTLLGT